MIVFDHKGGNEWWVEVKVTSDRVDAVYARAESGSFRPLTLRSWGNWAASFHIPPGERVEFAARQAGGMSDAFRAYSCYFTHPAGQEQCGDAPLRDTEYRFSASGNQWWQQVFIDSTRPVSRVSMMVDDVNGGKFYSLTKRSWGAWATSVNVPQGYTLQFFTGDGFHGGESQCYRWTQATVTNCPPDFGPNSPAPWMTRFDHKGGNEWWVEVQVGPVRPVRVLAQDDGGPWTELRLRDWGNWAGSFRIEPGHRVHFRAVFDDGRTQTFESCWFTHPKGLSPDGNQICGNTDVT